MTPSPNYGRRRTNRSTRRPRDLYLVGIERQDDQDQVLVAVAGPRQPEVWFFVSDDSAAVRMVQMLKAGMFSLPINPLFPQETSMISVNGIKIGDRVRYKAGHLTIDQVERAKVSGSPFADGHGRGTVDALLENGKGETCWRIRWDGRDDTVNNGWADHDTVELLP